jgi:hemolysin activation/secretion protein
VEGRLTYVNQVEIRRLGDAVMPLTIRLQASDGAVDETRISGTDRATQVTWRHASPLSDVQIDPLKELPDAYRLNNTSRINYAVRPLFDFPHPESYLIYPFVTLETNFIDGNMPRVSLVARYLDDQAAVFSVGYKETPNRVSLEGQLWRQRFPHPDMTTFLSVSDRLGARRLTVDTSLTLDETHRQYRIPANRFSLGYQVAFLDGQETFQGEPIPTDTFPSSGRVHSLLLGYQRDVRVPPAAGAPLNVLAEPLTYGYALRLQVEIASKLLGSSEPDFQQVRWEASEFLRLGNQTSLQLRVFGGWSAGTVPFQSKLTLAGVQAVRGYPYRLRFLGDRLLGGTLGLRFPILRDVRLEMPGRLFALRSVHLSPFIDAGWRWDIGEDLTQKRLRSGVGLRLIARLGLASLFRFETAVDIAYPLDAQGRSEGEGLQVWLRFQSTAHAGVH